LKGHDVYRLSNQLLCWPWNDPCGSSMCDAGAGHLDPAIVLRLSEFLARESLHALAQAIYSRRIISQSGILNTQVWFGLICLTNCLGQPQFGPSYKPGVRISPFKDNDMPAAATKWCSAPSHSHAQ